MKATNKIMQVFAALVFAMLATVACVEETPYEQGAPDVDGCYGVYFPAQDSDLVLDPADELKTTITVSRKDSTGAITVPFKVNDPAGIFTVSEIAFEDMKATTEVEVTFTGAEVGVNYACSISIEDPQYASTYSAYSSGLTITVVREKWNLLGKAMYTDDFITTFFSVENVSYEVEAYENDMTKGLYRFLNVWDEKYPYNAPGDWDDTQDYWFYVHAENPSKVYFEQQSTGVNWGYGTMYVWSLADYYLKKNDSATASTYYGTMNNGVIKFPAGGLLFAMAEYQNGGFYTANGAGAFKIILPGGVDVDYSFSVATGLTENGALPISFAKGADVASVSYMIYEGTLKAADRDLYLSNIQSGKETAAVSTTESSFTVTLGKTGVYTGIFVGFDKDGNPQADQVVEFTYLAAGDEAPVTISAGISPTSKYGPENPSDNTLEWYLYGKDITDAKLNVFTKDAYASDPEAAVAAVRKAKSLDTESLALLNESYVDGVVKGLVPGTEYVLVVWATNSYEETVVVAETKTTGKLEVSVEDVIGTYEVEAVSYFEGPYEEKLSMTIEASDNAELGNIMITEGLGLPCTTPIYGTMDTETNVITIPDFQHFFSWEAQGVEMFFANTADAPIEFEIIGKVKFTGSMFGIYLTDPTGADVGWYEVFQTISAKKVDAPAAPAAAPKSYSVRSDVKDFVIPSNAIVTNSGAREIKAADFTVGTAKPSQKVSNPKQLIVK